MSQPTRLFVAFLFASATARLTLGGPAAGPAVSQSFEQGVGREGESKPREGESWGFDGRWWLSVSSDEQLGFFSGFDDCYVSDVKGPVLVGRRLGWGPDDYLAAIGEYYRRHPEKQNLPLPDVLGQVGRGGTPRPETKGGEVWKGPHGYYNLLWWWQAPEDTRKGYLEGYLWCYRTMMKTPGALFSRPLAEYIALLNKFVESHPKEPNRSLAEILYRFRDAGVSPPKKLE